MFLLMIMKICLSGLKINDKNLSQIYLDPSVVPPTLFVPQQVNLQECFTAYVEN